MTRTRILLATMTALVLALGTASSALALAHPDGHGRDRYDERGRDRTEAPSEPVATEKARTKKPKPKAKKGGGAPELPNLAHVIYKLWPKSKIGHWVHGHMYLVRPIFALLAVMIIAFILWSMNRRRGLKPGRLQAAIEMLVEGLDNLVCGVLGKEYGRKYLPFLGGLFFYILCMNYFGLVPLMMSPTNFIATTAALALCTFLVVQFTAFYKLGFLGVLYHWAGEPKTVVDWCVAIILFPLHIMEEFIKPLSLALRLFGNIFGEDILLGVMMMIGIMIFSFFPAHGIPLGFPLHLPFMFLALLTSTIQALVFTLLSTIYILLVLPHDDHGHDEHGESAEAKHA